MMPTDNLLGDGTNDNHASGTERWMMLALIIVVSMAYLTMFLSAFQSGGEGFSPLEIVFLSILGLLYTFLVLYPRWITNMVPKAANPYVYFGVVYGLVLIIFWLSDLNGQSWLLILPPLGTAAEYNPKWLVGVSLLALAMFPLAIFLLIGNWQFDTLFTLVPAVFFVSAFSLVSVRERASRLRIESLALDLHAANQKLSDYAAKVEELTVVRERNRMARDVHDSLGHYLTVVNVQIGAAKTVLERDPVKAAEALDNAQKLTQEGLRDVRQSVALLREDQANKPLSETIPELVRQSEAGGLPTSFAVKGQLPSDLPPKIIQTVFRTIQEALTNIRKHAAATKAEIILDVSLHDKLLLTIRDDGQGAVAIEGGFGLMGMRERIEHAGGQLTVDTSPGRGLTIRAELPLPE